MVKRNADAQIATAKATADTAKVDVAKADEKIADLKTQTEKARVKQKELEQENLKLHGEVAKLQKEAADAQRALLELQERLKPRHLTDTQKTKLISLLRGKPSGDILIRCLNGNLESCGFAKQITDTLTLAGWNVNGPREEIIFSKAGPPLGLFIIVQNGESAPIRAGILQQALEEIGFPAPAQLDKRIQINAVELLVGTKP